MTEIERALEKTLKDQGFEPNDKKKVYVIDAPRTNAAALAAIMGAVAALGPAGGSPPPLAVQPFHRRPFPKHSPPPRRQGAREMARRRRQMKEGK